MERKLKQIQTLGEDHLLSTNGVKLILFGFFLINTICAFIVLGVFIRVILNVRMKNVLREAETMLKEMR